MFIVVNVMTNMIKRERGGERARERERKRDE